ncbi:MAG: DUF4097 family beta strand repeat-containing protein [Chloroflexota bacterium]
MNATDTSPAIEHQIGDTGSVTIRLSDWDVEIHAVDGDTARVRNAAGGQLPGDLEVNQVPGAITIRQLDRSGLTAMLGNRSRGVRLAIDVPAKAVTALHTASGEGIVHGLRGQFHARTASGDLMLVGVSGEVQVETVSGDTSIRLDRSTRLGVKTVSGDVLVEGGRVDRLAFTSTSGDLRLTSELGEGPHLIGTVSGDVIVTAGSGIRIAAQTVTGDLSSALPHTSEGRRERRSLVVGNGSAVLQFRSVSGDLRVVGPDLLEDSAPRSPQPPTLPEPPVMPAPPAPPAHPADAALGDIGAAPEDADGLEILRALERGEIDVDEATSRLARLDDPSHE